MVSERCDWKESNRYLVFIYRNLDFKNLKFKLLKTFEKLALSSARHHYTCFKKDAPLNLAYFNVVLSESDMTENRFGGGCKIYVHAYLMLTCYVTVISRVKQDGTSILHFQSTIQQNHQCLNGELNRANVYMLLYSRAYFILKEKIVYKQKRKPITLGEAQFKTSALS